MSLISNYACYLHEPSKLLVYAHHLTACYYLVEAAGHESSLALPELLHRTQLETVNIPA